MSSDRLRPTTRKFQRAELPTNESTFSEACYVKSIAHFPKKHLHFFSSLIIYVLSISNWSCSCAPILSASFCLLFFLLQTSTKGLFLPVKLGWRLRLPRTRQYYLVCFCHSGRDAWRLPSSSPGSPLYCLYLTAPRVGLAPQKAAIHASGCSFDGS